MLTVLLTVCVMVDPVWESVSIDTLKPGYECVLGVPGKKVDEKTYVYIPIDEDVYKEYSKLLRANDREGMKKLKKDGKLLECVTGDTIKVIEVTKRTGVEVRITSGREKGFKGFTDPLNLCTKIVPRG